MKLVVANHKMNLTKETLVNYKETLLTFTNPEINLVVCPSLPYLDLFQNANFALGSQNVGMLEKGSLTGEVSATQLKDLGVSYCIVGHSERRTKLNETDAMINQKIKELLKQDITPILCIGETQDERSSGEITTVLEKELLGAFKDLTSDEISRVVLAYEPIWAIGTGITPTNQEIEETISQIRNILNKQVSLSLRILYGGSVNLQNITTLEQIKDLAGYLVGGSSLEINSWIQLLEQIGR